MDRKLRILSPQMGFYLHLGGGKYDYEQLASLARLGHDVHTIIPERNRAATIVPPGITTEWIGGRSLRHPFTWSIPFLPATLAACRRMKPDILRIHHPYFLGLLGLAAGRLGRVPAVIIVHHLEEVPPSFAWFDRNLLPLFDGILCPSEATVRELRSRMPGYVGLLDFVYNGIDEKYSPGKASWGETGLDGVLGEEEPFFVFLGSLIPRKNVGWLIDMFSRYVEDGHRGHLVICGSGADEEVLKKKGAESAGAGRIHFLGRVGDDRKIALYRCAAAFVFPSAMEGFGLAPAEAMRCGTPAVVSDRGALPEVVRHGKTGFVLPLSDYGPWVETLALLSGDRARRVAMGEAAAADVASRFTWDNAGTQCAAFFERVCERHKTGRRG